MLEKAIRAILDISAPQIHQENGINYVVRRDGEFKQIREALDVPESLKLFSLDSLVKMIKTEALDLYGAPVYIQIPNHLNVICFGRAYKDNRYIRNFYYAAVATDVPGLHENTSLKFEEAIIAIRTRFQESKDTAYVLKLLSDISTGSKVTFNDNGIATSIVTKTGVALQTNEAIRPIVTLRPYRTFQEISQPESQFLIRINERGINFVEADGGMWKLEARETIKKYFCEALASEIESGQVVVSL